MLQTISTANPYIHQIRQSLKYTQPVAVDWLVLAHNDTQLLAQLDEAFPESVLAVLALPQHRLQMNDALMAELVEWAIAELGVKGVLLVGHSQGELPEAQVKLLGGKVKTQTRNWDDPLTASNSLLDRLMKGQLQATRLQDQLAEQMERLSQMEVVQNHQFRDQIQLHGLFYRQESGIFYAYDQRQRGFKPLLSETAVM
ncbi:MAG: hypothetical protein JNM09_21280 [Blastocatellia bacterium]|nr:hypothetical protein [Blastocatellia bacterium]